MVRPTLIDLNPAELKYYSFKIILHNCNGSFNVWSPKICVPKATKSINMKAFNMITNEDEVKPWRNIFHVAVSANSIVQYVIQIKNWIIKYVNMNVKIIVTWL